MIDIRTAIVFNIVGIFILFILLLVIFNISANTVKNNKQLVRRFYLKEFPLVISYHVLRRVRIIGQFVGTVLLTAIIAFTFINNITPLGLTVKYDMLQKDKDISQLGPKERVQTQTIDGQQVSKISDDLVYFTTNTPFAFDTANVKVTFKNPIQDQSMLVGFQDDSTWHYNVKPYDVSFLDAFNWQKNDSGLNLYQKQQRYTSVNDFFKHPPTDGIIGIYGDTVAVGSIFSTKIPNYQPATQDTIISVPLRGKVIFYVYVSKEPFKMKVTKQDLNWYNDEDPVTVEIYKDNNLLFQKTAPDDGITDASRKILPSTTININPSSKLLQSGVYKVVIDANQDTIIKSIQTNLHKIVFQGSMFFAGNSDVYSGIVASTSATILYTNALSLSAITFHNAGEQTVLVGTQSAELNMLKIPLTIKPPDPLTKVVIPFNDIALNAFQGYIAFSPDQFFLPSKYYSMPVSSKDDIAMVDYILTNYTPSHEENGWQVNQQKFDLHTAYINNNRLSWVIEAPKLKENNGSFMIKDIEVTFHKNGWL